MQSTGDIDTRLAHKPATHAERSKLIIDLLQDYLLDAPQQIESLKATVAQQKDCIDQASWRRNLDLRSITQLKIQLDEANVRHAQDMQILSCELRTSEEDHNHAVYMAYARREDRAETTRRLGGVHSSSFARHAQEISILAAELHREDTQRTCWSDTLQASMFRIVDRSVRHAQDMQILSCELRSSEEGHNQFVDEREIAFNTYIECQHSMHLENQIKLAESEKKGRCLTQALAECRRKLKVMELEHRSLKTRFETAHQGHEREAQKRMQVADPAVPKLKANVEKLRAELDAVTKRHAEEMAECKSRSRDDLAATHAEKEKLLADQKYMQTNMEQQLRGMGEDNALLQAMLDKAVADKEIEKQVALQRVILTNMRKREWDDAMHIAQIQMSEMKTEKGALEATLDEVLAVREDGGGDTRNACVVCWERRISHIFPMCNHLCLCAVCALQIHKCPVCQKEGDAKRVYSEIT